MFLVRASDATYMVATWCMTEAFSATHAVYIEDCEVHDHLHDTSGF